MKYCPLCTAEYKEERDRCSSCRAVLVVSLAAEEVRKNPPRLLWIGGSAAEFDAVSGALNETNIPALVEEGRVKIFQKFLKSESQICVLQNDFPQALETAANAIAALVEEKDRAASQTCYQCGKACSSALTVCPQCSATLILERPPKRRRPATEETSFLQASKYCPLCHAQYSSNYQHCSVCGVQLVPEEMRGRPFSDRELKEKIVIIWRGVDPVAVGNVVGQMREAGIRHHVESTHDHFVFELAMPRPRYVVRILESDVERARDLLADIIDSPFFGAQISPDFPKDVSDQTRPAEGHWNPAAANVELWSGDDAAMAKLLEDCLQENNIAFRREGLAPGVLHLFVMKNDETRAREILREIREGTPLV